MTIATKIQLEKESIRKLAWINTLTAVAGAFNCTDVESAIKWADKALIAYDDRFNNSQPKGIK